MKTSIIHPLNVYLHPRVSMKSPVKCEIWKTTTNYSLTQLCIVTFLMRFVFAANYLNRGVLKIYGECNNSQKFRKNLPYFKTLTSEHVFFVTLMFGVLGRREGCLIDL